MQTRLPRELKGKLPTSKQLADVIRETLPKEKESHGQTRKQEDREEAG